MQIVYPNYDHCTLGAINAVLDHYGAQTRHAPLPTLSERLERAPRNVIFMILDAMGMDILERHLAPDGFLRSHLADELSPVFPCTTVAAMSSYYSGLSPAEHGWLGWSLYFKEYARTVDTFLSQDSFSHEQILPPPAFTLMPYESIFSLLSEAGVEYHTLTPFGTPFCERSRITESFEEQLNAIGELCAQPGGRFIMSYFPEPDALMHTLGPLDERVGSLVSDMELKLARAFEAWPDALLILSADHGMARMNRSLYIDEMPEIMECLIMQPFIEPRAASLFVKPDMKPKFERRFQQRLGADFLLMTREEALQKLFGPGMFHPKTLDFVGDYMALGISDAMLLSRAPGQKPKAAYLGQHAGLTPPEMRVPLVAASK